jgi:WD40 repeat protein
LFSTDGAYLAWNREGTDIDVLAIHARAEDGGPMLHCLPGNQHEFGMASSAEGADLIAAGPDHELVVYNAATGAVRARLIGHTSDLTSIAVRPDGAVVAASDASGVVKLWDPAAGTVLATARLAGPYHGMDITGATGLTLGQHPTLVSLGAVDDPV